MAEGHCENFSLLMDRYLAYGDNRGQLQLLRELADRRALVPNFTGQTELIEAHLCPLATPGGGVGCDHVHRPAGVARNRRPGHQRHPRWRDVATSDLRIPDHSRHGPQRRQPRLRPMGAGAARGRAR